jgi:hypothetical protein
MALIGKKIVDEYDVPVRMSAEIFLDRHDREKASRKFLRRFGDSRQKRTVLQGEADETVGKRRFDYILNAFPKRIDIDRRVQM